MFLIGIHSSAIQLPESKEAIILPMYRKSILILLLIVLAVAGGTYYGCYMQEKESIQLDAASQTVTQGGSQEDRAEITVYVTGAINKPGVVTVREGARTADAVKACGGLLPTADGEKVNMAQVLKDGQQVRVPEEPGEVFLRYNELQVSQGYDLLQYSGEELTRYVYRITNYPDEAGVYYATLLVKDGQIVGADVASSAKTGVMHGLKMPE